MIYVQHRVNEIQQLTKANSGYGCEIDLRSDVSHNGHIHLSHDPFTVGDSFDDWAQLYAKNKFQGPLILNTKEDGLEDYALEIIQRHQISNFFFLDTTIPTLVRRTHDNHESHFAIRLSSFEPLELANLFRSRVEWVWADCFFGIPLNIQLLKSISKDFKVCLVSPELQTGDISLIETFATQLKDTVQAVCTKRPDLWEKLK